MQKVLDRSEKEKDAEMKSLIVGVCGGTGSGKTTLVSRLAKEFEGNVSVVSMDSFYKEQPNTTYEQRTKTNYDHPDSFDSEIMLQCVKDLKEGRDTKIPVYDFTIHNRSDQPWETVESRPLIIVEGILLFAFTDVCQLLDLKIFVDTDDDIRILRRILRDVNERARSVESVVDQYLDTVKPMHDKYIAPYKKTADIIVPEGGFNDKAFRLIADAIKYRTM